MGAGKRRMWGNTARVSITTICLLFSKYACCEVEVFLPVGRYAKFLKASIRSFLRR